MDNYIISHEEMTAVYEAMRTPVKLGMVLCEDGANIDCPNVFKKPDGTWGMVFAKHVPGAEKEGYETWLAQSSDLLNWTVEGRLLEQRERGWDCLQADGGLCLLDPQWEGSQTAFKYEDKYWMTYIGGSLPGYEPDPLSMGLAWSKTLTPESFERLPEPILKIDDADARAFEKKTLYKSTVLWDKEQTLGFPFVMYYNAKQEGAWIERIGMAVSRDMVHWQRFGSGPVVELGDEDLSNISGDPQIIRFGDLWVMHYFIAYKCRAWDTFACSKDLVHWQKWEGQPLIEPSESYDQTFAHKPYVLKYNGCVYHFYCAVGSQGRGIALAVSEWHE